MAEIWRNLGKAPCPAQLLRQKLDISFCGNIGLFCGNIGLLCGNAKRTNLLLARNFRGRQLFSHRYCACSISQQKRLIFSAKEPCVSTKEPYMCPSLGPSIIKRCKQKRPLISANEPYISTTEPCISVQGIC